MAPSHRRHYFAHPRHPLLAGLAGYRCNACDIDVHEACADYFKEAVAFFAHPWHSLTLSRHIPSGAAGAGWVCDLCEEECAPGSFVYRCTRRSGDRSPLHPEHDLCMVPSSGHCSACHGGLPVWQYVCGGDCLVRLHITSVAPKPSCSTGRVIAKFLLKASFPCRGRRGKRRLGVAGAQCPGSSLHLTYLLPCRRRCSHRHARLLRWAGGPSRTPCM
ncbi:hypothetical protein PVAP13_2NG606520 [Panicum virgatum]|uniref:Phorbol-ester/DAG-type domain-containing protein n=1 Tax=Panicum virgatum TaxID=38727 RepID=A0A8T0W495_PANVG|nr:hypothetical protein PVAP13_2NG606520 [Panicum virgatum]